MRILLEIEVDAKSQAYDSLRVAQTVRDAVATAIEQAANALDPRYVDLTLAYPVRVVEADFR
jgi:hypothetical protein